MHRAWGRAAVAVMALLALAWVGEQLVVGPLGRSERRIAEVAHVVQRMEAGSVQVQKTSWQIEGGTHTVETPRNTGESNDAWMQRHKDSVDVAKAVFPPV